MLLYIFQSAILKLYFDSFSVTLTEVFFSVGMDISMSRRIE